MRKTIRISKPQDKRIKKLVKSGEFVTESEVIRLAITLGLNLIEDSIKTRGKIKKE